MHLERTYRFCVTILLLIKNYKHGDGVKM